MKPVIALVGRPNVGKSTLFNRLTRSRDALVADLPGLTRDRHYGEGRMGERPFLVIDTGGFEPVAKEGIMHEMALQTRQAVAEADVVIFIVDGRQGLTPHDKTITDFLRKSGRKVMLVVNKSRGHEVHLVTAEFHELGMGDPYVISAAHGDGVRDLVDEALDQACAAACRTKRRSWSRPTAASDRHRRPSQRRQVDAGQHPARRRARDRLRQAGHHARLDRGAVRARRQAIHADRHRRHPPPRQGVRSDGEILGGEDAAGDRASQRGDPGAGCRSRTSREQDAHIAGFILEAGRALVVAVNKWDGLTRTSARKIKIDLERKLDFLALRRVRCSSRR